MTSVRRRFYLSDKTITIVLLGRYKTGGYALSAICDNSIHALTINHQTSLEKGEHIIKAWGNNKQIVYDLLTAGILRDTGKRIMFGENEARICKY